MLFLTRLSGPKFALNPDLIERAESTPDTVVTLVNGSKYVVRESLEELVDIFHDYRADLICASRQGVAAPDADTHSPLTADGHGVHSRREARRLRSHAALSAHGATVVQMPTSPEEG